MDAVKELEAKFLDFHRRISRDEHPARALTPIERETYAAFLETKHDHKGAASFRNYKEEKVNE